MHTTATAAEYLKQRHAIDVKPETVKQWCNRGKLPGAYRIGEGRRAVWQIPESALEQVAAKTKRGTNRSQNRTQEG